VLPTDAVGHLVLADWTPSSFARTMSMRVS
jgi:hypothetical protein